MDNDFLLLLYKQSRLFLMMAVMGGIYLYTYSKSRKDSLENPKYRMLEEDSNESR
jgi:hypothetical protein